MIDWDRLVVESENNGVIASAGQVALLVGADSDSVEWGNITGDLAQQADLMAALDAKIDIDSPTFTGIPRTPTPPAGNNSTRIASTAFVQGEISSKDTPNDNKTYGRKNKAWVELGSIATKSSVDYEDDITNKPVLGDLASKNKVAPRDIVHPTDIYVDPNGDDTEGSGSFLNPYKTITKALTMASDLYLTTIMINSGTYNETIKITDKHIWIYSLGTENSPVNISSIIVEKGTLELYGYLGIGRIRASYGSFVSYTSLIDDVNEYLRITASTGNAIIMEFGSVFVAKARLKLTSGLQTILTAVYGSVISAANIFSDNNITVDTVAESNASVIIYNDIADTVHYSRLNYILRGGFAGGFGSLADKNDAPSDGHTYARKNGAWIQID